MEQQQREQHKRIIAAAAAATAAAAAAGGGGGCSKVAWPRSGKGGGQGVDVAAFKAALAARYFPFAAADDIELTVASASIAVTARVLVQNETAAHEATASDQDAGRKVSALQALVDKAESDIRLKTEAVLHSALNDQYTTLPAIREAKRTRSQGGVAQRPSSARLTVKEQMQAKRQMDQLLKPNSRQAREFLEERFGIAAPPPEKPREKTSLTILP